MDSARLVIPPDSLLQLNPLLRVVTTILGLGCVIHFFCTYGSREKRLPPGPPTLPIIGNMAIFPRGMLHVKFTEWARKYGDVFSLKIMNKTMIVLNTPSAVHELIDKRPASCSNRPKSIIIEMITPNNMNMGTANLPDETWRVLRKAAGQILSNQNLLKHRAYQHAESIQLMSDLVRDPENFYSHATRTIFSTTLGIVYGCRSPLITSEDCADFLHVHPKFIDALEFGRLPPVDLFPILWLIPERFAEWKSVIKDVRRIHQAMFDRLLRKVENRIARGESTPAFLEHAIKNADKLGLKSRELLMNLGGVMLEASDTSSGALQAIILLLVSFPDKVKKAKEEIDQVIGSDRIPTWDDISNLPYTMAFIEECIRFRPVGQLGIPHEMCKDEVIDGVLYPKDAVVFCNTYAIFHDARYFDRPDEFHPERFLHNQFGVKDSVNDDKARRANMLFGGGYRVCPGIAYAKKYLELNTCNLIWGFDFLPVLDAAGNAVYPDIDVTSGFVQGVTGNPLPFKCRIQPRSTRRVELIKQQFASVANVLAQYELELSPEARKFNATYRNL